MSKLEKILILGIQIVLVFSPLVFAQPTPPAPPSDAGIRTLDDVVVIIQNVINWLFFFLIILSVFFFMLAAFDYLTSAGEKENIEKAKNRLIYGALALVIALLARGIPSVIASFFGVKVPNI
ncbi:MAG: hypothetical protein NZ484_01230 [Patescibacteria group bacterium]|nr:hypothetical protein [Patescibacteria group bacterium]MDW8279708.1 hypothetical protein [bacterium]